jgi:hypothetical protein
MPDLRGAVLLSPPDTRERHDRKQLTNLIRVGGRLAVLGVEDGRKAMGWWHIMRPGTFGAPQGLWEPDQEGRNLVYGTSLCGLTNVVTNGYSSDFKPPIGSLCPACAEHL